MTTIDNRVASLLKAATGDVASAEPNTGQGLQGEWPPAGDHDLYILSASEKPGKFKEGQREVECLEIQFEYQWIRDEKDPSFVKGTPPLVFRGERFQLVPSYNTALVEEGSKVRARINWERFTGHLTKILNLTKDELGDPAARYQQVKTLLSSPTRVAVSAKIDYRTWSSKDGKKSGLNKTEYITGNISG